MIHDAIFVVLKILKNLEVRKALLGVHTSYITRFQTQISTRR